MSKAPHLKAFVINWRPEGYELFSKSLLNLLERCLVRKVDQIIYFVLCCCFFRIDFIGPYPFKSIWFFEKPSELIMLCSGASIGDICTYDEECSHLDVNAHCLEDRKGQRTCQCKQSYANLPSLAQGSMVSSCVRGIFLFRYSAFQCIFFYQN